MDKLTVLYRMVAKPGRGDDVVAAYDGLFAAFDEEPGTEHYILSRSVDDPDVLWCSELFSSRAAFDEHRATALAGPFVSELKELLLSTESIISTPVKATGVEL